MTWVIGRAGPFGYAVGLSDIRVTITNSTTTKTEVDCLQKIYKIGPMLALGFAGSVKIGFEVVNQISAAIHTVAPNSPWNPKKASLFLSIGAKDIFNSFHPDMKNGGCELILLAAHPYENDGAPPWARCYVYRLYAPDFQPIVARPAEIVLIGSGEKEDQYTDALCGLENNFELFKMETMTEHGSALGPMMSVTSAINKTRKSGISNHLHICIVGRDSVKIGRNNMESQDSPEDNFIMPPVAQSLEELIDILSSKGIALSTIELAQC